MEQLKKKFKKVWHLWATIKHQLETEFCQIIDTSDFKIECVKCLRENFVKRTQPEGNYMF